MTKLQLMSFYKSPAHPIEAWLQSANRYNVMVLTALASVLDLTCLTLCSKYTRSDTQ